MASESTRQYRISATNIWVVWNIIIIGEELSKRIHRENWFSEDFDSKWLV